MKPIIKSISFTSEYENELEYFLKKANKSKYICELIKKDMMNNMICSREEILKLIDEKIKTLHSQQVKLDVESESNVDIGIDLKKNLASFLMSN